MTLRSSDVAILQPDGTALRKPPETIAPGAPTVHVAALLTFLGWWLGMSAPVEQSLLTACAVLIITCPCALALAVPAVQVITTARLFRAGILLKSATAAPLAVTSRHPLARSLAAAAGPVAAREGVTETAGQGLQANETRLGSRTFAGPPDAPPETGPELWLIRPNHPEAVCCFHKTLRPDAAASIAKLRALGLDVRIASGDQAASVARIAATLNVPDATLRMSPLDKIALVEALRAQGRRVLMVGDGLNDGPSLAAASVSASPSSAADISQTTADVVFQGDSLAPVATIVAVARQARAVMRENIGFSIAYNAIMLPLAVAGWVTPWLAAAAMSSSSLIVMLNSFRLNRRGG